jgi:hypothetical protein
MKGRLFPRDVYGEDFYDAGDRAAGPSVVRSPLIRRRLADPRPQPMETRQRPGK